MNAPSSVLVVDDEAYVRESLSEVLASEGWLVHAATGADEALELLAHQRVDVIVTDLRMPGGDAFVLLEHARARAVEIPIIVITGVGTVSEAVRAMKSGAYDFVQKPVDPEELVLLARRAAGHRALLGEVRSLRETLAGLRAPRVLVGGSASMERVRAAIARVAPTDAAVLITGESGSGKGLAAEEVHRRSARAGQPLVRVHGSSATEAVLREAAGGTLLVDEAASLPAEAQVALLRVLESEADLRLVTLTGQDLAARARAGSFLPELLYRLNVFPIAMPPLREHKEDIPAIIAHLLSWSRPGAGAAEAPREVLDVLGSYDWPGNVRELCNALERALIVAGEAPLDATLVRAILESAPGPVASQAPAQEFHLRRNLDAAERGLVLRALESTGWRKKQAALRLGIDPRNLGYYQRKHGITDPRPAAGEA